MEKVEYCEGRRHLRGMKPVHMRRGNRCATRITSRLQKRSCRMIPSAGIDSLGSLMQHVNLKKKMKQSLS